MLQRLHTLRRWAGIDRAVFFAAASRLWTVGAGVITLFIVGTSFSPEIQGYYFTFFSIIGLLIFLELGLSQSLVQFASHEFARLSFDSGFRLSGDASALSRLQAFGRLALQWYAF